MFVVRREGEDFEGLYRRFKRGMENAGVLAEYRRRQRFVPEHERRRLKILKARQRAEKRERGHQ